MNLTLNGSSLVGCRHTYESSFTPVQLVFRGFLIPLICLLGICANTFNAYVFSHKKMRNQLVNWFLFVLSVSDLFVLITSFFVFCAPAISEHLRSELLVSGSLRSLVLSYPVAHFSHTTSVYLTILVSVHRYLGICHPFLVRRIGNKDAVRTAIILALIFALIFDIPRWFELEAVPCRSEVFGGMSKMIAPTRFMMDPMYTILYRNALYTLIMFVIPFVMLTIVNCRIVIALKRSSEVRKAMIASQPRCSHDVLLNAQIAGESLPSDGRRLSSTSQRQQTMKDLQTDRREHGVTVMLVAMVSGFLIFNLLAFFNNLLEVLDVELTNTYLFTWLVEVSTLLVCFNGASTAAIYLLFGTKYRMIASNSITRLHNLLRLMLRRPPGDGQKTTSLLKSRRLRTASALSAPPNTERHSLR